MPELPDVVLYLEAIERHVGGRPLLGVRLASPFLLRSVEPPLTALEGRRLVGTRRIGKRLVLAFEGELFLVLHLMVSGRLRWKDAGCDIPKKRGLAAFDFEHGSILLTEASTKKRASLHVVRGEEALAEHDPGGAELHALDVAAFGELLRRSNNTLKRALGDPRRFSGIGNAYSDEILHRARLSPIALTSRLDDEAVERLFQATLAVLDEWTARLRDELGDAFPDKVTAFREGMAVHGRHGEPCPDCGKAVQRIVYATRETNYCPTCQTGGRLLADRALSQLLKKDWPKTVDEWERG